jgi:hypothetical protein
MMRRRRNDRAGSLLRRMPRKKREQPRPGEFHYFPLLPKELRDVIWEYAALPFTPGIHFFQLETNCLFNGRTWETRCRLKVPDRFSAFHVRGDNLSAYLDDVGVWDACCESRQLLEGLRLGGQLANEDGPILAASDVLSEEDLPFKTLDSWRPSSRDSGCDCSFGEHSEEGTLGPYREMLLNLDQDVICLNVNLGGGGPEFQSLLQSGHEILGLDDGIDELRCSGDAFPLRRLALEFHPRWSAQAAVDHDDPLAEQQLDEQQAAADGLASWEEDALSDLNCTFTRYSFLPFLTCVYFIDYRITPARNVPETDLHRPGTDVFRGKGATFYEVKRDEVDGDRWVFADRDVFLLAEALAEERAYQQNSFHAEAEEARRNGGGEEVAPAVTAAEVIRARADKWRLDCNQRCQFKVLACVRSSA